MPLFKHYRWTSFWGTLVVAISSMLQKVLKVSEELERERGISIEIIDPISLSPLDMEPIIESIKKTHKVIVAYDGPKTNGAGTEISARINEQAFEYLDCPIYRVAEKDCPMPFSPILEKSVIPQEEDIIDAINTILKLA